MVPEYETVLPSPHDAYVNYKATVLPQVLVQEPIWDLPCVEQAVEAVYPCLEHVWTPQLLSYNAQCWVLSIGVEFAYGCAGGV